MPLTDAIRHTWDPIAALTMTWGNGMTTDFRATTSDVTASNIRGGLIDSRRDDDATDLTATLTYTIMPGTKVYIPFPTLWGVELKQPLRTSLTVARRYRESTTALQAAGRGGSAQPEDGHDRGTPDRVVRVRPHGAGIRLQLSAAG